jgi:hypothetical protein
MGRLPMPGPFECDGTFEVVRFATPGKDGLTVKKLIVIALSLAMAVGICVSVTGCPSKSTATSTTPKAADGDKKPDKDK